VWHGTSDTRADMSVDKNNVKMTTDDVGQNTDSVGPCGAARLVSSPEGHARSSSSSPFPFPSLFPLLFIFFPFPSNKKFTFLSRIHNSNDSSNHTRRAGADPGVEIGGHMASAERESITGVWGSLKLNAFCVVICLKCAPSGSRGIAPCREVRVEAL